MNCLIVKPCARCTKPYEKSDVLGKSKCGGIYHYHCLVICILQHGRCARVCCTGNCSVEDIEVYYLIPKSSESHVYLEEMKLIKTELAKFSQNSNKQEEQQDELVAQFNPIESLQKANAQIEHSFMETMELREQLNEREKTIEALSKENAQLKQSSHNMPNLSELYKRLEDNAVTIESLKQEIAQLKLSNSNNSGLEKCSQETEKTVGCLVKSNEQTSTQQKLLLCGSNSAEPEENENKRFMQLEAQLAESNKNFMELQKLVSDIKENINYFKISSQSVNERTRDNTANNQYMFQDFKILLQNSSDTSKNTTGNKNKWTYTDEPQCVDEAKNIIAMKDRTIEELAQKLKDKTWELTVEQIKLQQYLFDENLPKSARN